MSKELIRLQDLVMEFDGERILDGINLYFNDHEFLTLLGPSGCGKTTTLRIIGGFLSPTSGKVLFDGRCINDVPAYERQINTVFQRYALFPHLNVYDNIAFGLKVAKLPKDEIHERVHEMLAVVGLKGYEHRRVDNLSGGQQRRVASAGVIAMEPEVLILDEPTAGLDPVGREEILKNIEDYRRKHNATIMMVSHSMDDVARLTDRLLVMNGSHLAMDGTPAEVFTRAEELVEMGLNIPQVTRVFLELKHLGLDVEPVYTIEQAVKVLKKIKGGADLC